MPKKPAIATFPKHIIPIESKDFRSFIANVLRTSDWKDIATPRDMSIVTAVQKDEKRGHSTYSYLFKLKISYRKHDSSTVLSYEVSEDKSSSQQKCQERLEELVATVDDLAQNAVMTQAEAEPPTSRGAAHFADEAELADKGFVSSTVNSDCLVLAPLEGGRYITVPPMYTNMHGLVCGPTGVGKSSAFFIPNIVFRTNKSMIITEATAGDELPDLYAKTAGWRRFKGSHVYFFNPDYARGTRINPLDILKDASESNFPQLADDLANLVIINTTPPTVSRADPIWDKSEKHLLWIMIMHVASCKDPGMAHFGAIREMLRKSDRELKVVLQESNSHVANQEYAAFLSHSSENFRHGVFAGLLQRLNPFLSSVVQTMTSATDLDLNKLRSENFTFYISVPSRKLHLKPIAALIFNFIMDLVLYKKFKNPPALLLDEFTNFGAIPGIDTTLSLVRKRDLPVMLGYQNHEQLVDVYGKTAAKKIVSQLSTRVFFRPRDDADARNLSTALDYTTVLEKNTDDMGRTQVREVGKRLMSVQDIMNLPPQEVIIMTEATHPIKTKRFDHLVSCPPPVGFDLPDLPEHELIQVKRLSDADLAAKAEQAKENVSKDASFQKEAREVSEQIDAAKKKYSLNEPKRPKDKNGDEPGTSQDPPPQKPKTTSRNWDIPG